MHALETALQLRVNVKLEFAVNNLLHLCLKIRARQQTFQLSTLAGSVEKGGHTIMHSGYGHDSAQSLSHNSPFVDAQ
jgi:hypothetical protein